LLPNRGKVSCHKLAAGLRPGGLFQAGDTNARTKTPWENHGEWQEAKMTYVKAESASPKDKTTSFGFYGRRRQFIDEILFSDLEPIEKIYALAVAQVATRVSDDGDLAGRPADSTYTGLPTFAQRLGIEARKILTADRRLRELGRIKVETRGGREHRAFVLKHDAPMRSIKTGSKESYRRRGRHIQQVLFDPSLTPAQRAIGVALTGLPSGTSLSAVASYLHIARKTATRAMKPLISRGHYTRIATDTFSCVYAGSLWSKEQADDACKLPHRDITEPISGHQDGHDLGHDLGHESGQHLGHDVDVTACPNSETRSISKNSVISAISGISGNSLNSPTPSESASASRNGVAWRERCTPKELDDFVTIRDLIEEYSSGTDRKTIAGIEAVAEWRDEHWVTIPKIHRFVQAGLLDRDGDVIAMSDLGRQAYEWVMAQPGLPAVTEPIQQAA
jgi:hypothetical protein